ncbi:MAG: tripartite tricarboxylate transporter substrate binding protein [Candidatus Saccharibacteria bacterium]|nr:tripartite tricarboxylate transporter substrate binding protein [Rhodoferax sp.]
MVRKIIIALTVALVSGLSGAQGGFPTKPVTIIVGVAPGGTLDALARLVAQGLAPILKQPVLVENVTGAGGLVGFQRLMKAEPDGYTLNFSNMSLLILPHMYPKANFDPVTDLAPVTSVATVPMVLAVSNASGIKDLPGLLASMRRNPGKTNFGSGGPGTTGHLSQALFLSQAKVDGMLLQYRGTGPALVDVMSGTIDGIIDQTVTLMPLHTGKRVRAIAVSTAQRLPQMPDVPTFIEGGLPQFDLSIWNGLVAPKGTPRAALDRLAAAVSQVMDSPEYRDRVEKQFASQIPDGIDRGPDAFRRLLEQDAVRVSALVKSIGMQPAN